MTHSLKGFRSSVIKLSITVHAQFKSGIGNVPFPPLRPEGRKEDKRIKCLLEKAPLPNDYQGGQCNVEDSG